MGYVESILTTIAWWWIGYAEIWRTGEGEMSVVWSMVGVDDGVGGDCVVLVGGLADVGKKWETKQLGFWWKEKF